MSDQKWALRYDLKCDNNDGKGFTREETDKICRANEDAGFTDALLICSIIYGREGGLSHSFLSHDGKTEKPISSIEKFKVWASLAHQLCNDEKDDLQEWQLDILQKAFESVRAEIMRGRDE